jgi:hypothetical protein
VDPGPIDLAVRHQGGQIVLTAGVAALEPDALRCLLVAVADFDRFDEDNDPWDEHDCAVLELGDQRYIWKIDYFDEALTYASPDPTDPRVTRRVLTVMRSDEY